MIEEPDTEPEAAAREGAAAPPGAATIGNGGEPGAAARGDDASPAGAAPTAPPGPALRGDEASRAGTAPATPRAPALPGDDASRAGTAPTAPPGPVSPSGAAQPAPAAATEAVAFTAAGRPAAGRPGVDGAVRSAISQAIVQIHAERYGKGATQAKTYAFDDVIVTVMRDVLTPVERTLADAGRADAVRELRAAFQEAMGPALVATVEELTGRNVSSVMTQVDPAGGIALAAFVLAPASGGAGD